ncbi:MAG: GEVED domain-containing protein [Candidatus Eisenbacteria bacterium]
MKWLPRCITVVALLALTTTSAPLFAHDVDGPNDCGRNTHDMGDAPEGSLAYPGVIGHFPTCLAPTAPGTFDIACTPPLSTPPGPTGFVINVNPAGDGYWLGCGSPALGPMGIDSEADAKVNSDGSPFSFCTTTLAVDCFENAFGMKFGQDECYGDDDAGLADSVVFIPCRGRSIPFRTYSCATFTREAYLNILVDWNHDGDWNDNSQGCPGNCVYEWAVKNILIQIPPGCATQRSPIIVPGATEGPAWMRITISDEPVTDDFPWNGSAGMPGQILHHGETEDYPVSIRQPKDPCLGYTDFGDAPEGIQAYPSGVIGNFPTCLAPGGVGTFDIDPTCGAPRSIPPGPAGYVEHVALATDQNKFWLGCGPASGPPGGVDSENNGKVSVIPPGAGMSACDNTIAVDCIQSAWAGAMHFGQDECYGDDDAGIASEVSFVACTPSSVNFNTYSCGATAVEAYLNVLVDWNEDGDWNDDFACPGAAGQQCAYEWAVKNIIIPVLPGCTNHTSPIFTAGPRPGHGWMRISISAQPVPDDFPWNGSAGMPGGVVHGGETEDYPVTIRQGNPCAIAYTDFGDAPEDLIAYSNGVIGHFPTCTTPGSPGTMEIMCGTPVGPPPGPTGFVMHAASATDPIHYWLGCGTAADPTLGIDSEPNGKVSLVSGSPFTGPTTCNPAVPTDCDQSAWGLVFGQDECYGDLDAGVASFVSFRACSLGAVPYNAYLCVTDPAITVVSAYLNVLVDWNQDGDWNDILGCGVVGGPNFQCAPEWAVMNQVVSLTPGCNNLVTPNFRVGPQPGQGWMRITLSEQPAAPDFPWNGTFGMPNQSFSRGETEDYPVVIRPSNVDVAASVPKTLEFAPIVPNPSRGAGEIRFGLPRETDVSLVVYDVTGREVNTLIQRRMPAGPQSMHWDFRDAAGRSLPAGIYVVVLRADGQTFTRRAIHLH